MIVNIHEREFAASGEELAELLATLSSEHDRLWPFESWPRMRLDRGLMPGAKGGHGPVRYTVESVDPRSEVVFRFTGPSGFVGWHAFSIIDAANGSTTLRHELRLHPRLWAYLTWPLFFRPLHDALLEEAFDKAGRELGEPPEAPHRRGIWASALRATAMGLGRPRRRRR